MIESAAGLTMRRLLLAGLRLRYVDLLTLLERIWRIDDDLVARRDASENFQGVP